MSSHRLLVWICMTGWLVSLACVACSDSDNGGGSGGTAGSETAGQGGSTTGTGGTGGGSSTDGGDCQTAGCPTGQLCAECLGPDGSVFVCINPDEMCTRL